MAITYPLSLPTSISIGSIELMADNVVARSESPFTFAQQIVSHAGQRWRANVTMPPMKRAVAAPWQGFLLGLKGGQGTFLMGHPLATSPLGTSSSATITGTSGSDSLTVTMTGTLLAGDYIQLGSGSDATLHMVLEDQSGNGTLEVFPALRKDRTSVSAVLSNPKGLFRLATNTQNFSTDNASIYGIQFEAVEAV